MDNKFMILILFLFLITANCQEEYWRIGNNTITINPYLSTLTEDQRDDYYYWVGLRNSFYFADNTDQLEKLVKYFTPEEENYYKNLCYFSVPGFICAAAVIVIFIIYLIKRFLLKGCLGPKKVINSYHYATYFFIICGFVVGLTFLILTVYNCSKSK